MSDNSKIHWTESTWNPIRGCTRVSVGCENCYAERMAARFSDDGLWGHGYAERTPAGARWTGKVELIPEKLGQPLRWRKPRRIFVNSTSDLFHESLSDEEIAAVFGVMAACPQHTFQVLTKRPERMRDWFGWLGGVAAPNSHLVSSCDRLAACWEAWRAGAPLPSGAYAGWEYAARGPWPLPNVWLGVSVEDQATADERIPPLLQTQAAVRFVSAEPLLGPVVIDRHWLGQGSDCPDCGWMVGVDWDGCCAACGRDSMWFGVDWVISGGESGPADKIRPADLDWFRSIRDQCEAAGVPYFHKQNGGSRMIDGAWGGRELDGRTHDAMPELRKAVPA